jgi:hypothetical protein
MFNSNRSKLGILDQNVEWLKIIEGKYHRVYFSWIFNTFEQLDDASEYTTNSLGYSSMYNWKLH